MIDNKRFPFSLTRVERLDRKRVRSRRDGEGKRERERERAFLSLAKMFKSRFPRRLKRTKDSKLYLYIWSGG